MKSGKFGLTPQCRTQDLGVETLLVFADFWRVAVRPDIGGIDVNDGNFPCLVQSSLFLFLLVPQEFIREMSCVK